MNESLARAVIDGPTLPGGFPGQAFMHFVAPERAFPNGVNGDSQEACQRDVEVASMAAGRRSR